MRLLSSMFLAVLLAGCAADPQEDDGTSTDTSGNQPICLEARARVAAQCKGAPLPSFEKACVAQDRCRAGCVYDHPCSTSDQDECVAEKC
jgi:hypothetical protein